MAQNYQTQGEFNNTSSSNQVFSTTISSTHNETSSQSITTLSSTYNNETSSQSQQHTSRISEQSRPFHDTLRAESSRETYDLNGNQSSTREQAQYSTLDSSHEMVLAIEDHSTRVASNFTGDGSAGTGAGLFNTSEGHEDTTHDNQYLYSGVEEQMGFLEKGSSRSSSDSSFTKYGYSGAPRGGRGTKLSNTNSLAHPFVGAPRTVSDRETHCSCGLQSSNEEQVQRSTSRSDYGLVQNIGDCSTHTTGALTAGGTAEIGARLSSTSDGQADVAYSHRSLRSGAEAQTETSQKILMGNTSDPSFTKYGYSDEFCGGKGNEPSNVSNSSASLFSDTLRAEAGRKPHYLDGSQSSDEEQVQSSTSGSNDGLVPNIEDRSVVTTGTLTAGGLAGLGAGLFNTAQRQAEVIDIDSDPHSSVEVQTDPSKKSLTTGQSGSSSTEHVSDNQPPSREGAELSEVVNSPTSRGKDRLISNIEDHSTHTAGTLTAGGIAGISPRLPSTSNRQVDVACSDRYPHSGAEAQTGTSQKGLTRNLSNPSITKYGYSDEPQSEKGIKPSDFGNSLARPSDDTLRTESGRETYYPDGQQSANEEQVQRSTPHRDNGLVRNIEDRSTHTAGILTAGGIARISPGRSGTSDRQADIAYGDRSPHRGAGAQTELSKKGLMGGSGNSPSIACDPNGQYPDGKGIKISDTDRNLARPFGSALRTESGRETGYPDGHQSPKKEQLEHSISGTNYGLVPKIQDCSTYAAGTLAAGGLAGVSAGFLNSSGRREDATRNDMHLHSGVEEQTVPLGKVSTRSSSDSSFTRYGSHGRPHSKKGTKISDTGDSEYSPIERTVSRPEIDTEERKNLQRALTGMSVSRQGTRHSIAEPNDPSMDPSSDSFDLTKFLRSFRHYLEGEGIEMKQLSVVFKNLNVYGSGAALQLQKTVTDMLMAPIRPQEFISFGKKERKQILHGFDGIIKAGELCVVLGRPGSGCSTLLKALTGELHGLEIDGSEVHYNGIEQHKVIKEFKGETVYNQEVDKHFPHLTVGQTLEFAAAVRTPSHRPHETSRKDFAKYSAQVVMAVLGLSHTHNTKVGNDFVRGVSGGERKRVSVAEMLLAGAPFASWDNSTRGLDSATALKFVRSLRIGSDMTGGAAAVAIYQASQSVYDCFDKAAVLYEGRQIYFGPANNARDFFERQGWYCPPRQTTGDFLTAVTNPDERQPANGYENKVPRTPEDFERYWRNSPEYQSLLREIQDFEKENPLGQHSTLTEFREKKNYIQAKHARPKSPYLISIPMQIKLNTVRAYQRIWGDFASTATQAMLNLIMALIVGSIYFGHSKGTSSFQGRGAVLFLAVLFNALTSIGEISGLYSQRPIVEKHNSYAFYHPATEAIAGIVADIPVKFIQATVFNIVLYFLAQLRYTPGQFFLYFLITYITTFVMAAIFRSTAALTKTASQAMALAGVLVLFLVIYTGFVIRIPSMHPWFSWIRWINPVFYAFEILLANEFHGVQFPCDSFIPMGPGYTLDGNSFICNSQGAVAGRQFVSGDDFIAVAYEYSWSHVWRNFGILIGFLVFFMILYFIAVELNSSTTNTAEQLVFQRGHVPAYMQQNGGKKAHGGESARAGAGAEGGETDVSAVEESKGVFTWRDVVYDIEIKGEPRRLLDHVSGYVKPGTLTALMGVSGAGKTTLLDSLAQRTTTGVITGDMLVNGKPLDPSFQRSTGYVQQQDLHLETSTVREALRFSAVLRQPKSTPKQEKYDYVEEVIKMLNMEDFANAVVGVPGEGLNVEQRKLLTIGVELAAKPKLLLFLDEPTSGLDSQSSWSIVSFLRKLASAGQAILCTIHQPSAILFQEFDRLLFLAKGGKTVYFGDIGENSQKLLNYFENSGARKCGADENPAEYMLEIVNAGKNDQGEDWFSVWKKSEAAKRVQREIDEIHEQTKHSNLNISEETGGTEFAMPITIQIWECTYRVFQQYWRMPEYVLAKILLCVVAGLFIGFSFYGADSTQAGMQNIIFSVFMLTTIFSSLVQQIQPLFITQRNLYESRERPSKAYSWIAFMIANILVELPYGIFAGILMFASFYYPVVGAGQSSARQGLVLMFSIQLLVYTSSFAAMTIAALPNAETASGLVSLLTLMSILFNGVLQTPDNLPGFWMFMYRVSPFTYWISGMVSTMLAGRKVVCSSTEVSVFDPPSGQTCGQYLGPYAQAAMGTIQNPDATAACRYCAISNADQFLAASSIYYSERWRNFGILFAFISFNVFLALLSYWLFRVLNLSNLTAKFHKTNKGAKAKGAADKVAKGAGETARQGAHPGNRSGEKDIV